MSEDDATPEEPTETATSDPYASAVQTMRETAKWLVTALAAVAATLLAGTQLSSLGAFEWQENRLLLALASSAVALFAVGRVIWATTRVLTPEWLSIPELVENEAANNNTDDMKFIKEKPHLLGRYDSVGALQSAYEHLISSRNQLIARERWDEARQKDNERKVLGRVRSNLLFAVRAERIRRQLDRAVKIMFRWGILAAVGIILFVWAANPPADSEQSQLTERIEDQQRDINSLSARVDAIDQKTDVSTEAVRSLQSEAGKLREQLMKDEAN